MNAKIVSLAIMISVSSALLIDPSESASKAYSTSVSNGWQYFKQYQPPSYDTHAYPKYEFEYAVSDKITGDHKHQHETRDGNRVHGEYSLIEADGSLRRVQYNADHYNGFHAIVSTSVQKHGDGAISTFGHTRQFLPIGHGVKINHFFPKKDYTPPKDIHSDANLTRKPIKEIMEETFQNNNSSDISLDTESITIQPKYEDPSTKLTTDNDIPILKMETIEGPLMEIMPTEIPSTTDYITTENSTDNNHLSEISENNDGNSIRENNTSDEHQHLSKLNHSSHTSQEFIM